MKKIIIFMFAILTLQAARAEIDARPQVLHTGTHTFNAPTTHKKKVTFEAGQSMSGSSTSENFSVTGDFKVGGTQWDDGSGNVKATVLAGNIVAARMTNALAWDGTNDWTGTFDGEDGSDYHDAGNLTGDIASARLTNALSVLLGSVDVAATTVDGTNATIAIQCKDIFGNNLEAEKTLLFWFTTTSQQTTPSEEGIASWSFDSHGTLRANFEVGDPALEAGTNYVRCASSHTDGSIDLDVIASSSGWTNHLAVYCPANGAYTNVTVEYTD